MRSLKKSLRLRGKTGARYIEWGRMRDREGMGAAVSIGLYGEGDGGRKLK